MDTDIVFHCMHKKNDIYKDIAKMLKQDLTLQIMNYNGIKICWVKSKNLYLLNRR